MLNVHSQKPTTLIQEAEIISVRVSHKTVWRHLILRAGEHAGTGEFTLDPADPILDTEASKVAAALVGRGVEEPHTAQLLALGRRDLHGAAIVSAIDQALNDLRARIAGLPLAQALAGERQDGTVSLYANVNRRTLDRSPDGMRKSAELAFGRGFSAVKIAPFDQLHPRLCGTSEGDRLIGAALDRIAAVRDGLPSSVSLQVDCHWRLTEAVSRKILPELSRLGVCWFECPLPENTETLSELIGLRRLANTLGMRTAGCETMTGWEGFEPYVEGGAYDVIMPDIKYVGGIDALREVVSRAADRDIAVSLHNPTGPICHLHSVHACIGLGLTERLEIQFDESQLFDTIVHPAIPKIAAGEARLPMGPGLGVRLTDEIMAANRSEIAALQV